MNNMRISLMIAGVMSVGIASAQLFETDYASHTQPFTLADDEVANVALNGAFSFYGTSYNSLSLSTNGNINFSGNNDFFAPAFPSASSGPVIAALWSDWFVDTEISANYSRMFYDNNAQRFIATWDVRLVDDETITATFQAVLNKTTGDIFFGYGQIAAGYATYAASNGNRTGLNAGDGVRFTDGMQNLASSNTRKHYALSDSGNYTVVPEPGTMLALAAGLAFLRKKRSA
jgi:uncharacterized cupin superfamily protein